MHHIITANDRCGLHSAISGSNAMNMAILHPRRLGEAWTHLEGVLQVERPEVRLQALRQPAKHCGTPAQDNVLVKGHAVVYIHALHAPMLLAAYPSSPQYLAQGNHLLTGSPRWWSAPPRSWEP